MTKQMKNAPGSHPARTSTSTKTEFTPCQAHLLPEPPSVPAVPIVPIVSNGKDIESVSGINLYDWDKSTARQEDMIVETGDVNVDNSHGMAVNTGELQQDISDIENSTVTGNNSNIQSSFNTQNNTVEKTPALQASPAQGIPLR